MEYGIIYARVSTTQQQDKGLSIPGQIERCREALQSRGIAVAQVFEEAGSASESAEKRTVFQDAVAYALDKNNSISAFCVYDTSRFARRREDAIVYKRILRKKKVRIIYVDNDLGESDDDLFIEGIYELMDERYSRILGKLVRRGMVDNAKEGFFNGGKCPLGYQWVKKNGKLTMIPDGKYTPLIEKIFAMYCRGNGCTAIAQKVNIEGWRTKAGKRFKTEYILKILRNEKYIGNAIFSEIKVEGSHDAIIRKNIFEKAQGILKGRAEKRRDGPRIHPSRTTFLSGLIYCGLCHSPMVSRTAGSKGKTYHYYECVNNRNGTDRCEGIRIRADLLDAEVKNNLIKQLCKKKTIRRMMKSVTDFVREHNRTVIKERGMLKHQIQEIDNRIGKIYDVIETHKTFDAEDLAPRISQLKRSKAELQNKLEQTFEVKLPEDSKTAVDILQTFMRQNLEDSTAEEFALFAKKIGVRIDITPSEGLDGKGVKRVDIKVSPNKFIEQGFIDSSQRLSEPMQAMKLIVDPLPVWEKECLYI